MGNRQPLNKATGLLFYVPVSPGTATYWEGKEEYAEGICVCVCVCVCVYEWRRLYPNGVPMPLAATHVFGLCFPSSHYILTLLIASFRPSRSSHSPLTSLLPRFVFQPSVPYNLNSQTSTTIPTHISIFILHAALYIYFGKGGGSSDA
jgi:hypothetical protein